MRNSLESFIDSPPTEIVSALPTGRGTPSVYARLFAQALQIGANHHNAITQLARRLMRAAELAYGARNIEALESIAQILSSLPLKTARDASLYYRALLAKRCNNLERAKSILEPLTSQSSGIIQARAIQSLATVFECLGQTDYAAELHLDAMRHSREVDLLAAVNAGLQLSAIRSVQSDHNHAMVQLEKLYPLVRVAAQQHPHLWPLYHNEVAVELAALRRFEEARAHSRIATASPLAAQYQEWHDTAAELRAAERVLLVVPDLQRQAEPQRQVKRVRFIFFCLKAERNFTSSLANTYPVPLPLVLIVAQVATVAPIRAPSTLTFS